MTDSEVIVRLKITSPTTSASAITAALGVEPDRAWSIGDARPRTTIKETVNGWLIGSGMARSESLEVQINRLLRKADIFKGRLEKLPKDCEIELSCVIYSRNQPALNLAPETIRQIGEMRAGLDIDVYVLDGRG